MEFGSSIYEVIRFDFELKVGSLIDTICYITGKDARYASSILRTLITEFEAELASRVVRMKYDGKGKPTPMGDIDTMMIVASLLTPEEYEDNDMAQGAKLCFLRWAFDLSTSVLDIVPRNCLTREECEIVTYAREKRFFGE